MSNNSLYTPSFPFEKKYNKVAVCDKETNSLVEREYSIELYSLLVSL